MRLDEFPVGSLVLFKPSGRKFVILPSDCGLLAHNNMFNNMFNKSIPPDDACLPILDIETSQILVTLAISEDYSLLG